MKLTVDIIEDFIKTLDLSGVIVSFSDDGTNTTLIVDKTFHARKGMVATIDDVRFEILAVSYNQSITIAGVFAGPLTLNVFVLDNPFYFHGTPIMTNNHISQASENEKTPMVYLYEILKEKDNPPNDRIRREADTRFFFLDSADFNDWSTDEHYSNRLKGLNALVDVFIESAKKNKQFYTFETQFNRTNHVNWGVFINDKGHTKRLFNDNLTGVELSFNLKVYDDCKTGVKPPSRVCAPATAIVQDQDGKELARRIIPSGVTEIITINIAPVVTPLYLLNLDPKNRFIDIEFNKSLWSDSANNNPLTVLNFSLDLITNGGDVSTVGITGLKQIDSEIEAEASSLVGGEMFVRLFINPDVYPSGIEQVRVNITGAYNVQGNLMEGVSELITLSPLPYAVTGRELMYWDAEEAYTEGIPDIGQYVNYATYEATYEGTKGTDADGTYVDFDITSAILNNQNDFERFENDYLMFVIQKYEGDLVTVTQGNLIDFNIDRTVLTYPFGNDTWFGAIMAGSPNANLRSANGNLTNNKEVIRFDFQSFKVQELYKDGVLFDQAGVYTPFQIAGNGRIGSQNGNPTTQNFDGKIYKAIVIKGSFNSQEITDLQNYFQTL